MLVLKANLDEAEAKRLGDMLGLGACELFVEEVRPTEYKLFVKFKVGHILIQLILDKVES